MNIENMTFGIEIETILPRTAAIVVGPHGAGYPIQLLRNAWLADSDPSIRSTGDYQPCEFVSPVFQGSAGLAQLITDIQVIKSLGAKVNSSCGFHIHIGFDKNDADASARLVTLVANFEKAIYASTGTKNRERGRWCAGMQRYQAADAAIQASRNNRYHLANFGTRKPTVEFRAFSGTLNVQKIVASIRLCAGLVERAVTAKRITNWAAKAPVETSPIHRSGEGQTALTRLFYQLGWIKGRQPHTHGQLMAQNAPDIARSKKTLMLLARQYDAQA